MGEGLTQFSAFGGCGAKLSPQYLDAVISGLSKTKAIDMDDCAVHKIDDDRYLLNTIDFFTPVVDDPYVFGQIVATNSLNDIYAMGGTPIHALNIVEFPIDFLDIGVLTTILSGAEDKVAESGAEIVGGHSIKGDSLKYGMSVLGEVSEKRLCRNSGARDGDALVLTKELGVGIITTAAKGGAVDKDLLDRAVSNMTCLNKKASEIMGDFGVHACTDITGFGLIGHAVEVARASKVCLEIDSKKIPIIDGVAELIEEDVETELTCENKRFFSKDAIFIGEIDSKIRQLLYDPQTAGGLLIAIEEDKLDEFISKMEKSGVFASVIGNVKEQDVGKVKIK